MFRNYKLLMIAAGGAGLKPERADRASVCVRRLAVSRHRPLDPWGLLVGQPVVTWQQRGHRHVQHGGQGHHSLATDLVYCETCGWWYAPHSH